LGSADWRVASSSAQRVLNFGRGARPAFDATTFSKNRKRLLDAEVADGTLEAVVRPTKPRRNLVVPCNVWPFVEHLLMARAFRFDETHSV